MNLFATPFSIVSETFDNITNAYYSNGANRFPSADQLNQIAVHTSAMEMTGKLTIGGGAIGVAVSYIIWSTPYVGPLVGLVGMVASASVGILGYDMQKAAQNLQVFADKKAGIEILLKHLLLPGYESSQEKFDKHIKETATKGTIIAKSIANFVTVRSKQQ